MISDGCAKVQAALFAAMYTSDELKNSNDMIAECKKRAVDWVIFPKTFLILHREETAISSMASVVPSTISKNFHEATFVYDVALYHCNFDNGTWICRSIMVIHGMSCEFFVVNLNSSIYNPFIPYVSGGNVLISMKNV